MLTVVICGKVRRQTADTRIATRRYWSQYVREIQPHLAAQLWETSRDRSVLIVHNSK